MAGFFERIGNALDFHSFFRRHISRGTTIAGAGGAAVVVALVSSLSAAWLAVFSVGLLLILIGAVVSHKDAARVTVRAEYIPPFFRLVVSNPSTRDATYEAQVTLVETAPLTQTYPAPWYVPWQGAETAYRHPILRGGEHVLIVANIGQSDTVSPGGYRRVSVSLHRFGDSPSPITMGDDTHPGAAFLIRTAVVRVRVSKVAPHAAKTYQFLFEADGSRGFTWQEVPVQ